MKNQLDVMVTVWTVFGIVVLVAGGLWKAAVGILLLSAALSALLVAAKSAGRGR